MDKVLALFAEIRQGQTDRSMLFQGMDYRRQVKILAEEMLKAVKEVAAEESMQKRDPSPSSLVDEERLDDQLPNA